MLDKPHGPPTVEELATASAATKQRKAAEATKEAGAGTDDDASATSGVSTGASEAGSEYEGDSSSSDESEGEGMYCLNVDGTRRPCAPQLHRRRSSPGDVLVSR